MKGNIGLTNNVINKKVNKKKENYMFGYTQSNKIDSHVTQTHKRYTNILPHKQIYDPTLNKKDDLFCYEFMITNNDPNKFLVLKDLFLFSFDDVEVNDFYPNIKSITHEIKKNNDKILLNEFDGESLKAINILCKYNNKYCLHMPIISSYGVIDLLGNSYINFKILSSYQHNFKMLGIFNHVACNMEIERFTTMHHQYLNVSFDLRVENLNSGNSAINFNNTDDLHYRSIILITDKKSKIEGTLKTNNFNTNINLAEIPHLNLDDKVIFLITNSYNKKIDNICNYPPQGTIRTKYLNFEFVSEIECSIKIICQTYNILTLFKEM